MYRNKQFYLTVTGIGKSAMAAGVAYTLALFSKQKLPILVNLGIAGHRNAALNEVFLAHKITDAETKKSYFPQLTFTAPCQTLAIMTVSRAEFDYQTDSLYDMEASAFFETAARFSSSELIHSIKVISDNASALPHNIKPVQVSSIILESITILDQVLEKLTPIAQSIIETEPEDYQKYLKMWHFTVSRQQHLLQLLSRWQVLADGKKPELELASIKTAKTLLRQLELQLNQLQTTLSH